MPSSPRTPTHSRKPSTIDIYTSSPRRHSKTSLHTPTSPRHSLHRTDSLNNEIFGSGGPPASGLGNLADELGQAWSDEDDDDYEEPDMNFQSAPAPENEATRDSGVDVSGSLEDMSSKMKSVGLTPPTESRHRRVGSEYDGSDYGEDSDIDSGGLTPGLVARMDLVESLARRGTENTGGEMDDVVKRVVEELKDLGGQAGVESGAMRLATAHGALTSHLLHQTRLIQSLAYPILSPLSAPPTPEVIDALLPLLLSITESIPRPSTTSLTTLSTLNGLTADLIETLSYLSDTLHMSRQTTTAAARRLKSALELVAEMRREEELREEGERWLRRGNWGERLGKRECARVCGEVVEGFESVCEGWRRRLLEGGEVVGA